jgi:hypothetical protein
LVAIPTTGRSIPVDVMFAFHAMAYPMNYGHMVMQIRGQPVDVARESFAEQAIAQGCKYIFFWDEDVACPPQSVPELIYRMEHTPDAAVCGGVYCLKTDPPQPLVFRGNGNGGVWDWKAGEFFEASGVGMGCTVVRTEVFKDLKKPWFKTEFNYEKAMDGKAGVESWSEDLWFCKRVTDTNKWKVYIDGSIICSHYDFDTLRKYDLPPDSKPLQHTPTARGKKKILDLGSGSFPYESKSGTIIRCDEEKYAPDYRLDIRKLPFDNKVFDVVFSPALERYESSENEEILNEWIRVMKDDGELRLVMTDVNYMVSEIAKGKMHASALYQTKHKQFIDFESIKELLKKHEMSSEKVPSDIAHIAVRARREINGTR